jgi:hypothetical protein
MRGVDNHYSSDGEDFGPGPKASLAATSLEAKFLQYADAHREHYRALLDLAARTRESLETLNRERDELFKALRAAAERLDDASSRDRRGIVAPLMERDR